MEKEDKVFDTDDLGLEDLYNVASSEEGTLTFFNLGTVHIDYAEMKR